VKQLAAQRQRWLPVAPKVTGFFHVLDTRQWNLHLRVMIYRQHVGHESPKNFQLDLFYCANSAWQQLSILAHNLVRSFELDTLVRPMALRHRGGSFPPQP
jgi:hypothetical protein